MIEKKPMQSHAEEKSSTLKAVSQRVPLWRDVVVIKWVTQIGLLAVVVASLWFLAGQAGDNLRARNINTGFDFLERPPDIQLSEGIDTSPATGGRALWSTEFAGYEALPRELLDGITEEIRERKGLKAEMPKAENYAG